MKFKYTYLLLTILTASCQDQGCMTPDIVAQLRSSSDIERRDGELGLSIQGMACVKQAFDSSESNMRLGAIGALRFFEPDYPQVADLLRSAIDDEDPRVRREALRILFAKYPREGRVFIAHAMETDQDPWIRSYARSLVEKMGVQ